MPTVPSRPGWGRRRAPSRPHHLWHPCLAWAVARPTHSIWAAPSDQQPATTGYAGRRSRARKLGQDQPQKVTLAVRSYGQIADSGAARRSRCRRHVKTDPVSERRFLLTVATLPKIIGGCVVSSGEEGAGAASAVGQASAVRGAARDYLGTRPGAEVLYTSCADGLGSPRGFYLRYGFTDTGWVMWGENVLALDLAARG